MFAPLQSAFATALLDPERAIPDGVTSHSARVPEKRFAVYRNNVIAGLVNALRARFPATERIVGDEFFAAMARLFVMAHPPRSKILSEYGDDLPAFIADFPPAAELPYLADVARLEAARTRAYHAADADSVGPQAFAGLAAEQFPALRLRLHPSAHVIRSMHPVVSIWAMNTASATSVRSTVCRRRMRWCPDPGWTCRCVCCRRAPPIFWTCSRREPSCDGSGCRTVVAPRFRLEPPISRT